MKTCARRDGKGSVKGGYRFRGSVGKGRTCNHRLQVAEIAIYGNSFRIFLVVIILLPSFKSSCDGCGCRRWEANRKRTRMEVEFFRGAECPCWVALALL